MAKDGMGNNSGMLVEEYDFVRNGGIEGSWQGKANPRAVSKP